MENLLQNLSLPNEEDEELILDVSIAQPQELHFDHCLLGRLLTDREINFSIMRSRLASLWRPGKGVNIKDISPNLFLFQFFHPVDLKRVLEGGPWTFENQLLILHKLNPGDIPSSIPLVLVDFWIQVYDLPLGYMSMTIGKQIGDFIGKFVEYDDNNNSTLWRNYMRIKVSVDVRKPLKRFKKIRKAGGDWSVVNFKYEKLSTFCYICGHLGHSDRFCACLLSDDTTEPTREWGPWLRAPTKRGSHLGGEKWLREEKGLDSGSTIPMTMPSTILERDSTVTKNSNLVTAQSHDLGMNKTSPLNALSVTSTMANSLGIIDSNKSDLVLAQ